MKNLIEKLKALRLYFIRYFHIFHSNDIKMKDLEIFDKDGKELHITDIISRCFTNLEETHKEYDKIVIERNGDDIVAIGKNWIDMVSGGGNILIVFMNKEQKTSQITEPAIAVEPVLAAAPIDNYIEWQQYMKKTISAVMGIPKELLSPTPKQITKSKRKWWCFWRCS